jgi:hypothetical protein
MEREAEKAASDLRRQIEDLKERLWDAWFRKDSDRGADA